MPFVKEMTLNEDGLTDISNTPEFHQKALKTTSSPAPGVTQVTRTFYQSSTPRGKRNTVTTDLARVYSEHGIPLADSKKRKLSISSPKVPVPGAQKIVSTSLIKGGEEKLLDVSVEPVYPEDTTYRSTKRPRTREVPEEVEDKGWFRKILDINLFGSSK